MYKTRLQNSIIGTALILVAVIALLAYGTPASAQESNRPNIGMGDLHRFESQQILPNTGAEGGGVQYAGMGDLRRTESQQILPSTGADAGGVQYVGIGDLRRIEALQENHLTAGVSAPSP